MLLLSRNLQQLSDIEKNIPLEDPTIIIDTQSIQQESSLRKDTYYTIVPKNHVLQSGILPEDQSFFTSKVIFWKTAYALSEFSPQDWDYVQFALPASSRHSSQFFRIIGDCYSLPTIHNTWDLQYLHSMPQYVE